MLTYKTVEHMPRIGVMFGRRSLRTDEFHDFVLSFARDRSIGDDDFDLDHQ